MTQSIILIHDIIYARNYLASKLMITNEIHDTNTLFVNKTACE